MPRLSEAPILGLPSFENMLIVEADASDVGIGAVIMQNGKPLSYFSRRLGPRMRLAATYQKELFAIVEAVYKWRQYFLGHRFTICTDHRSLKELMQQVIQTPLQYKYVRKLMGFNFAIEYKTGTTNMVADALSRVYDAAFMTLSAESKLKELLLSEFHNTSMAGHSGVKRMLTEVVNRGLEQYLRAMVSDRPQHWAVYGRLPHPPIIPYPSGLTKVAVLEELLIERDALLRQLKQSLAQAKNRMVMQANRKHHHVEYKTGDMVLVKLQPYRQVTLAKRCSNKLAKRYYGPFEVLERIIHWDQQLVRLRDNALDVYKLNLEKAEAERDQLKQTLEKFQNSSKSLNKILECQVIDKFKKVLGYNAATTASPAVESFVNLYDKYGSDKGYHLVPPPLSGNFIPHKPDLTFIDAIVESENLDVTSVVTPNNDKTVENKGVFNTVKSNTVRRECCALINEELVSDGLKTINTARSRAKVNAANPKAVHNAVKRNRGGKMLKLMKITLVQMDAQTQGRHEHDQEFDAEITTVGAEVDDIAAET
ncbi:ty3-gypsy retrotransposon protein [Tanacetum coccineum]